jgi:hypothetical protein
MRQLSGWKRTAPVLSGRPDHIIGGHPHPLIRGTRRRVQGGGNNREKENAKTGAAGKPGIPCASLVGFGAKICNNDIFAWPQEQVYCLL